MQGHDRALKIPLVISPVICTAPHHTSDGELPSDTPQLCFGLVVYTNDALLKQKKSNIILTFLQRCIIFWPRGC